MKTKRMENTIKNDDIVGYDAVTEEPISRIELHKIANKAVEDVKKGNYITHEDMMKRIGAKCFLNSFPSKRKK